MMLIIIMWYLIGVMGLSMFLMDKKDRLTMANLVCSLIVGLAGGGIFILLIHYVTNKQIRKA